MHRTEAIELPNTIVGTIHQDGTQLSQAARGAVLLIHYRHDIPVAAEIHSNDGEEGGELGLWWNGRELADFDGAFEMPKELASALRERGWIVGEDFAPMPAAPVPPAAV
jgi:hypothetical protein